MARSSEFFKYEVLNSLIQSVPLDMAVIMRHTAYSPVFHEMQDFSTAVLAGNGDLVAQYVGTPIHLAAMEKCVKHIVAYYDANPEESLNPGDVIIHNDPYDGGSHLPDINIVVPIFWRGEIVAFSANRGHHCDVGGANHGSFAGDCTSIFEEGVRIPTIKFFSEGQVNRDMVKLFLANVRAPKASYGDLMAQVSSCRLGEQRIRGFIEKYGVDEIKAAMDWALDYSEKRMRAEIASWPDGVYECGDYMDSDGVDLDRPVKVHVKITVEGDGVTVDFSGSDPAVTGPINGAPAPVEAAAYIGLLALSDPTIPAHHGCYRPVTFVNPPGTVTHAEYPAALVSGNTETSTQIIHLVLFALAKALPEKVAGCDAGTPGNLSGGDQDHVYHVGLPSGMGARATKDGLTVTIAGLIGGATAYMCVEMFENIFPYVTEGFRLVQDSGGPGKFKGGMTMEWTFYPANKDAHAVGCSEKCHIPPPGIFGGMPGLHGFWRVVKNGRKDPNGEYIEFDKTNAVATPDDLIIIRQPAGGGYGNPLDRDLELLQRDIDFEYVSVKSAERDYGAVVNRSTNKIDVPATQERRKELRAKWKREELFLDEATMPYARNPFRTVTMDGTETMNDTSHFG